MLGIGGAEGLGGEGDGLQRAPWASFVTRA
jgi:hypothetical protein